MEHILKLEQVKKYYGGAAGNITKAVDGISMEVNKGEFTKRIYCFIVCAYFFSDSDFDDCFICVP